MIWPSASAPRRAPTSWASSPAPSTRSWTGWPRACATSSACRPSSRTSCVRRWRGSSAEIELLQRRERSAEDRSDAYAVVARSAEQMSGILETLMAAARAEAQLDVGRSEVGGVLDRVAEGWAPAVAERDVEIEVRHPAGPMMAGVDAEVDRADRRAAHRQRPALRALAHPAQRGRARRGDRPERGRRRPRGRSRCARPCLRARPRGRRQRPRRRRARPAAGTASRPGRRGRRHAELARSGARSGVPGAPPGLAIASAGCRCARSSSAPAGARRRGRAGRCRP